jgi:hypothetical protein
MLDAAAGNGAGVKGPKARPCPRIGVRMRGGALWRKGIGPVRPRARTRTRAGTRRGGAFTGGTARYATVTRRNYASERVRVDVGSGTCKKFSSQPGTKASITSGGAEHRAFLLGWMAGVSTRGEQRSSTPLWLLAEVQCVGVVWRCGLPARRKKRKAAARRRGSRGSRGCSRSRRVRLLPRAAPVFAGVVAPTGGSKFSLSPFLSPSPPTGW